MDDSSHNKLTMFLAIKAVCDAKPSVWQSSEAFENAYLDFCTCIENIIRRQPANGGFNAAPQGILAEIAVADEILTSELDELIELFEAVDVQFVDDYTAARSMSFPDEEIASESVD